MLIRTTTIEDLADVHNDETVRSLGGSELLAGSNAAHIGDTEADENATFLLNRFSVTGSDDPVEAWLTLTNWYTSRIGVDNSTALLQVGDVSGFAFVNYARLPSNPPSFLLNQLLRPSFHRLVRGTLKRHQMRALPGFYRMIH